MLRRRRGRDEDQPEAGLAGEAAEESDEYIVAGPWDVNDDVPQADRIDFGCLQVPVAEGCEVQVSMADDQPAFTSHDGDPRGLVVGHADLDLAALRDGHLHAAEVDPLGLRHVVARIPRADLYVFARLFCGRTGRPGLPGLVLVAAAPSTQHLKLPTALR